METIKETRIILCLRLYLFYITITVLFCLFSVTVGVIGFVYCETEYTHLVLTYGLAEIGILIILSVFLRGFYLGKMKTNICFMIAIASYFATCIMIVIQNCIVLAETQLTCKFSDLIRGTLISSIFFNVGLIVCMLVLVLKLEKYDFFVKKV